MAFNHLLRPCSHLRHSSRKVGRQEIVVTGRIRTDISGFRQRFTQLSYPLVTVSDVITYGIPPKIMNLCDIIFFKETHMRIKESTKRFVAGCLLASVAFGFSLQSIDQIFYQAWNVSGQHCLIGLNVGLSQPSSTKLIPYEIQGDSELMAQLFQLLFILFLISPPLMVVLLFCIWKELKEKNSLK